MNRRQFLISAFGVGGAALVGLTQSLQKPAFHQNSNASTTPVEDIQMARRAGFALGAKVSMLVLHSSAQTAPLALDEAFAQLEIVESVMSLYRPNSQLAQLNRVGYLDHPHPYLVQVLSKSVELAEQSRGAFDISVQPLWELYSSVKNKKSGAIPSRDEIAAARAKVDWRKISISNDQVVLKNSGMALTLNGIAQGFAADRATEILRRRGVTHALLNTGEFSSLGRKADGTPWAVGIQHPRFEEALAGLAQLDGLCLSTSGDYETSFSDDFIFNHIFDPATGCSPLEFSSVTVVAPTAAVADGLSTAVFVAGVKAGSKLLATQAGCSGFCVLKDGRTMLTDGFPLENAS
jgi:thiamine biosynthesis lipoprotein